MVFGRYVTDRPKTVSLPGLSYVKVNAHAKDKEGVTSSLFHAVIQQICFIFFSCISFCPYASCRGVWVVSVVAFVFFYIVTRKRIVVIIYHGAAPTKGAAPNGAAPNGAAPKGAAPYGWSTMYAGSNTGGASNTGGGMNTGTGITG